ncbi:DUF1801 domain-containing protein [Nonomuraea sp. CA-218870]|uniref:DUF1801 domain-containing protein n=1 Tax=Nonomuraea sp. CA-218870 TaxID=3239998 RepID=UPI003D8AED57
MSAASKAREEDQQGASPEDGLSEAERAAVKQRAAELRTGSRRGKDKAAADERDVLEKIAQMPQPDRALAERVHAIVLAAAPELAPKLFYGQPAYARAGKVVCFFRSGQADAQRYSTFGFNPVANLDEDEGLWPTSFALAELTEAGEETIRTLVRRAVS